MKHRLGRIAACSTATWGTLPTRFSPLMLAPAARRVYDLAVRPPGRSPGPWHRRDDASLIRPLRLVPTTGRRGVGQTRSCFGKRDQTDRLDQLEIDCPDRPFSWAA